MIETRSKNSKKLSTSMKNSIAQNDELVERKNVRWQYLKRITKAEHDILVANDWLQKYMQEEIDNEVVTYITTKGTK
jgi:hypothetical protein